MHARSVHDSPRRGIARRVAAAGMALAAVLALGACKTTGGGFIGTPLDGGPVSVFSGRASFGFNSTCEMNLKSRKAVLKGQITYRDSPSTIDGAPFPEVRLHGVVKPVDIFNVASCQEAAVVFQGLPSAQFAGTYRSQDSMLSKLPPGKFSVLVFDQGEPGRPGGDFNGDTFSIELVGGVYNGYTRAGNIEGGNIQVS